MNKIWEDPRYQRYNQVWEKRSVPHVSKETFMECLQMSLPLMPATFEELYVDQAMVNGAGVSSAYTPYGIKEIDSLFCWRIQKLDRDQNEVRKELRESLLRILRQHRKDYAEKRWIRRRGSPWGAREIREKLPYVGEGAEAIRKDILDNPHLHACIKENLLDNLSRVESEKQC